MQIELFIKKLKQELSTNLPGEEFQNSMASPDRFDNNTDSDNSQKASVLILLYPSGNQISTVLIKRAFDNYIHSGQIALPGGRFENCDTSSSYTALREAKEEIGINPDEVQVLGLLTSIYIPVSNFLVFPVVGYLNNKPGFRANPDEVQEIIEISLQRFFVPENIGFKIITKGNNKFKAPCYKAGDHKIWGATAMILSEFEELVKRTGLIGI